MMKQNNITLSFPKWNDIKRVLKIQDPTNPATFLGNHPYQEPPTLPWEIKVNSWNKGPYGIDIPVLLEPNNKKNKVIIILGESALRKDGQLQDSNKNVILGTPYAIHLNNSFPKDCEVYKLIFDNLLNSGYSLYLTDIIKVWEKGMKMTPKQRDIDCFKKELEEFPDATIVTFGNTAKKALKRICPNKQPIELFHPCKNCWIHWKAKIFEDAIFSGNPQYAKQYYPNKKSPTTPQIVAGVALDEILSKIPKS